MALVEYQQKTAHAGVITLNDADNLNAMSEAMADEFALLVEQLRNRSNRPRVIVLTGAGRAFSAGGDLSMLRDKTKLSPEENRFRMLKFYKSFLGLLEVPVPLIAAINGHAIGAGLCVAAACDIRICAKGAKLGFTFTKLGLHPGMAATYFLPRLLGDAVARELLLTSRIIEAEEALKIGLVTQLYVKEDLEKGYLSLAAEIAQTGAQATASLVNSLRAPSSCLVEALEREAIAQSYSYASGEFLEGVSAAIEKRAAKF